MSRSATRSVARVDGARRLPARWLTWPAGVLLLLDAALLSGLAAEGSVLAHPGGAGYVVKAAVDLGGYAVALAVVAGGVRGGPSLRIAAHVAAIAGLLTGVMWIGSLAVETFAGLTGPANIAATAPLLLGGFAVWGGAAAVTRRRTGSVPAGVLSAVLGAMLCVALTVGFGWILAFLALPRLEHNINGSPEYLASHWGNLHAFAIANSLDAGFVHLLLAPIVAAVTGTVGAVTSARRCARAQPRELRST